MGSPHEGSIQRPIAPRVNALTTELYLVPPGPDPFVRTVVSTQGEITQPNIFYNRELKEKRKEMFYLRTHSTHFKTVV